MHLGLRTLNVTLQSPYHPHIHLPQYHSDRDCKPGCNPRRLWTNPSANEPVEVWGEDDDNGFSDVGDLEYS